MEYAIQLLLPILGGLLLGNWLTNTYGLSPIWTLVLAILGMLAGLGILYKRSIMAQKNAPPLPKKKQKPDSSENRLEIKDLDFLYKQHDDDDDKDEYDSEDERDDK